MSLRNPLHLKVVRLDRVLTTIGMCPRSKARSFIRKNNVKLRSQKEDKYLLPKTLVNPSKVLVNGEPLDISVKHVIAYKPSSHISSTAPGEHKSVYHLLPSNLLQLKTPLRIAGRLDKWVTGLVFFTQDGELAHKITSPKSKNKCAKIYQVKARDPFNGNEGDLFASGEVMLRNESKPLRPAGWRVVDEENRLAEMTLYEGRYHQVRRMLASVGNKAIEIERKGIGPLSLGELKVGEWRHLTVEEVNNLYEYVGIKPDHRPNTIFDLPYSKASIAIKELINDR